MLIKFKNASNKSGELANDNECLPIENNKKDMNIHFLRERQGLTDQAISNDNFDKTNLYERINILQGKKGNAEDSKNNELTSNESGIELALARDDTIENKDELIAMMINVIH